MQREGACRGRECLIRSAEWRAGMDRSRERRRGRTGAGMRMRRAAADGELQAAASCRWRGDAGGGEIQVAGRSGRKLNGGAE